MNEEEIRKLIKGNLPIAVKNRNGKMIFPYRNLAIFDLIVDELTKSLIKNLPNELRAVNRNEAAKEVCVRCGKPIELVDSDICKQCQTDTSECKAN